MIQTKEVKEGEILNRWMDSRLKKNKNILVGITGPTGSGKSYMNHRIAENWYKFYFKEDYPLQNTCFSIGEVMKLLSSGKLRKGEFIILEEAGTSLNSLDFQNRISKLFSFILQSFRSMNIILFFNLPVLTMLNKSARLLLHAHFIMQKIEFENETSKCKPLFHQLNQERGKSYWKYLRVKHNGKIVVVKRLNYKKPSQRIINTYEQKKFRFVNNMSIDFSKELEIIEREKQWQMARKDLTDVEKEVFEDLQNGFSVKEIADRRQCCLNSVYQAIKRIEKKGFTLPKGKITNEIEVFNY